MTLFAISFAANVAITFAVSFGIWRDLPRMGQAYGPDSPARRILMCIYLAIGLVSLYALVQMGLGRAEVAQAIGVTLFPLQIVYKLLTAWAVSPAHPVVIANLGVVALLAVTLLSAP